MGLGMGFPGTGNIGPKTDGNREHRPQNSREQGTFIKNSGTREHAAGTTEHWLENGREHGTMALKAPGTGNIDPKTARNREHWPENSREQGTSYPPHSESQQFEFASSPS